MILKLKNKHILGLQKILEKGETLGGVPNHFEVHPSEAYHLLCELNELYNNSHYKSFGSGLSFNQYESCEFDIKLWLHGKSPLTREHGEKLVKMWHGGQFSIKFKGIKVQIVIPKKKTKPLTASGKQPKTITGNVFAQKQPEKE